MKIVYHVFNNDKYLLGSIVIEQSYVPSIDDIVYITEGKEDIPDYSKCKVNYRDFTISNDGNSHASVDLILTD